MAKHENYLWLFCIALLSWLSPLHAPLLNTVSRPARFQPLPLTTVRCDRQYSTDMADTLVQFSGLADKRRLNEYRDYMIMVKQYLDLGYMLRTYEQGLTSEQRFTIRNPMQHYVNCRTTTGATYGFGVQQFAPPKALTEPCESQYAFEIQTTLNQLGHTESKQAVQEAERYLIALKQFEDIGFKIGDFEKRTPSEVVYKLRGPQRRYDNCIDAIIRSIQLIG